MIYSQKLCKYLLILMMFCLLLNSHGMAEEWTCTYEDGMRLVSMPRDTEATDSVTAITAAYFTCDQSLLTVGEEATWTLTIKGQSAHTYTYDYSLAYQTLEDTSNEYEYSCFVLNGGTTFSATPNEPGRYFVSVTVKDQYGGQLEVASAFYIAVAAESVELADKVAAVVELCNASGCTGDYDIALFMHDYLINNACYDLSYTYYYPEGVLLYGTGVCQSYSLAYQILMEEMGIECLYVTGVAGDDDTAHSWNLVNIDGRWYHVDCTWDDPVAMDSDGNVLEGYERHDYFCIYDDEMAQDHTWEQALYPESAELLITEQPVSVSAYEGKQASVSFVAVGDGLVYEWYEKMADESDFTKNTAFTSNTYTVEMTADRDGSQVYCVVTDEHGNTVTTDAVTLTMEEFKYPESEHSTPTYSEQEWYYTHPEEAYALKITFDGYTCIAFDSLLYLTTEDGTVLKLSGQLSSDRDPVTEEKYLYVVGNSFALRLVTGSDTDWGFTISSVDALTQAEFEMVSIPQFTIDSSGVITDYHGCASELVIPAEIDGIQVTGVGEMVFRYDAYLTSISFPDSVTYIGFAAFQGCAGLTHIEFPPELNTIDDFAFQSCIGFTAIDIPYGVESVGKYAFARCTNATSVSIPDSVTSIGDGAFEFCEALTTVEIPDSVTQLGGAFSCCFSLVNVKLPRYITEISEGMFHLCRSLESIELPEGVTSIGAHAFEWCESMTSISIPYGVTSIGAWAFNKCSYLREIPIPDSVQSIGEYAFHNCNLLQSIHIPEGVTRIERNTFHQAWSLTEVHLPDSITYIGDQAFLNDFLLTKVNIPEGVTYIGKEAFMWCALESVVIPSSVTTIGENAFAIQVQSGQAGLITVHENSYAHAWVEANVKPDYYQFACDVHTWDAGTVTKAPTSKKPGVMTYTCSVCNVTKEEEIPIPDCLPGDADDNGIVDIYDALLVLQYNAGWEVTLRDINADYDGDGIVDISDALEILLFCADGNLASATRTLRTLTDQLSITRLVIMAQPTDQYAAIDAQAQFAVSAAGDGLTYQWYIDRNDGNGWCQLKRATSAAYVTSPVELDNDGYQYRCVIKDAYGNEITSEAAALHVVFDIPSTGDASEPMFYALAMILSGAVLLYVCAKKKAWQRSRLE